MRTLSILPLFVATTALAAADVQFGGARSAGMGGAGLALPLDVAANYRLNPSLLAFGPKGFSFAYPSLQLRLDGVSFDELRDTFGNFQGGGIDPEGLARFAAVFGGRRRDLGLDASLGVLFGGFALTGGGQAAVSTLPNETLRQSAPTPADGSQLDAYGLGFVEVAGSYGAAVKIPQGRLALGGTLKSVRASYAHQIVSYSGGQASVGGGADVGGADYVSQSGIGLDLGLDYSPASNPNLYYGLVIQNAIAPNLSFDRQLPDSGAVVPGDVRPFRSVISAGVGAFTGRNTLVALDIIDVGNRTGRSQLALGGEYRLNRGLALRAGYNTRYAFSVGVSVFGFNVAFGRQAPFTIGAGFRF